MTGLRCENATQFLVELDRILFSSRRVNTPPDVPAESSTLDMSAEEFRSLGHRLVDQLADFQEGLPQRPVYNPTPRNRLLEELGDGPVPPTGTPPQEILDRVLAVLQQYSRHNGHPRFLGYIVSPGSPIGALGELMAATFNQNVAASFAAPMAAEIEMQAVRWIAELIGYPSDCDGLFVSGGSMANILGLQAALSAAMGPALRTKGVAGAPLRCYTSKATHAWIKKAVRMSGLGTDSIAWVDVAPDGKMSVPDLERRIREDIAAGLRPFMVVGNAGTTMTGAIDPLPELAALCRQHKMWFHVDGAYGAVAAILGDRYPELAALEDADSLAIDAHKWLYAPVEAGCILVKDNKALSDVFDDDPEYIHSAPSDHGTQFFRRGPQHSRQFRAHKVWLAIKQLGRAGYERMIGQDIRNAQELFERVSGEPDLEATSVGLSITTFRFVPSDLRRGTAGVEDYLNQPNEALLTEIQASGECYISKAVSQDRFLLRACFINYRTTRADIAAVPEITLRLGRGLDKRIRPKTLTA